MISAAELISLYGGKYEGQAPSLLPSEIALWLNGASSLIVDEFPQLGPADTGAVSFVLVKSSSMDVRVFTTEEGSHLILMPVGIPVRLYWLAHAICEYWAEGLNILLTSSPLDDLPPKWYEMLGPLSPLFTDTDGGETQFWSDMGVLAPMIHAQSVNEGNVLSQVKISCLFLLWHELAHIYFGHFSLLRNPKIAEWRRWMAVSESELNAGLECQADIHAAKMVAGMLLGEMNKSSPIEDQFAYSFSLLVRGIMLMLGSFWPTKKFLNGYKHLGNQHPLIRREVISQAIGETVYRHQVSLADFWARIDLYVWQEVIWATNRFSLDAPKRYNTTASFTSIPFLSALSYGTGHVMPFLAAHQKRAAYLLSAAEGILMVHNDLRSMVPSGADEAEFFEMIFQLGKQADARANDSLRLG